MRPISLLHRALLVTTTALTCAWLPAAATPPTEAPLRLLAVLDGRELPFAGIRDAALLVHDGDRAIPLPDPTRATWLLTGDIHAHADFADWMPTCRISRDARVHEPRYRATVKLEHRIDIAPRPETVKDIQLRRVAQELKREPDPFAATWPGEVSHPSIVIVAWIVSGRIVATQVQPVPSYQPPRAFTLNFEFELAPGDERGHPIALLWRDGTFAQVEPFTQHPPTMSAWRAVVHDDAAELDRAIHAGARLDRTSTRNGSTLLHLAAALGSGDCLERLLERHPKLLNMTDRAGDTALTEAALRGRTHIGLSLAHRYESERAALRATAGAPALLRAVEGGHTTLAERVARWFDPASPPGTSLLGQAHRTACFSGHPELAELLPPPARETTLSRAIQNQPHVEEEIPLEHHARAGHLPMIDYMLAPERRKKIKPETLTFALVVAAEHGRIEVVKRLLAAGADPGASTDGGITPLIAATRSNRAEVAAFLLAAGAPARAASAEGMSALHHAAEHDALPLVRLLLEAGADAQLCNIRDATPLDLALLVGARDSVQELIKHGACIGLGATYSHELLQAAITQDVPEAIATALEQGWPASSTFAGVWPALRLAEAYGARACARVLRAAGATASPDRPFPTVPETALDAPVQVVSLHPPDDPRTPDEEFPATTVRVRTLVDAQGRALFPQVLDRADPRILRAALRAALHTTYTPPTRNGSPVAVVVTQHVRFAASRDRIFLLDQVDTRPQPRREQMPYLPQSASKRDRSARVAVEFVVNTYGRVEQVSIVNTSGPDYTDAALLALSEWTFAPGLHRGTPVPVRDTLTFSFDAGK